MNDPVPSRTGVIDPDDYNVYAVEMYPDSVRFFINDTHVNTYPRIEGADAASQFPYYRPMYLMIDMQLGGQWVGRVFPRICRWRCLSTGCATMSALSDARRVSD